MRKMKQDTKKNVIRVIMFIMAIVMILSFVILPLAMDVAAEEDNTAVTVTEFDTGALAAAIEKAKDGTDLNLIKKISVSGSNWALIILPLLLSGQPMQLMRSAIC